ncbi:MAG: thioredoxin domain-containing protein [Deltaproteobacteria bacterium]|nr:thioredoxin domain-containing protein [Deltaproteobacteria bacterium]
MLHRRPLLGVLVALVALATPPALARAQTPACAALPEAARAVAREALGRIHPYDCCDDTLAQCLAAPQPCALARRLADDVCRQAKAGRDVAAIEKALAARAQSMVAFGPKATLALDEATRAGAPDAPVVLAVYACSRCPFCKVLLPQLYQEVTSGALAGKVRLYLRPFPLKSHAHSTEGDLALVAAGRLGRFWPYTLMVYERADRFDAAALGAWAVEAGMDGAAFAKASAEPAVREALAESKKEGLRNKVSATPAVFIDGRPYGYELQLDVLVDVLLEEHERLASIGKP